MGVFPPSAFPSPGEVLAGFGEEARRGRLVDDIIASLFRVAIGYLLAVGLGVPLGCSWITDAPSAGPTARRELLPQPVAAGLDSVAILWFAIGDAPAIFLIFMASFPPLVLATTAAAANIPAVYFVLPRYGLRGNELLTG
jgi:NitT/TauT family transport system permease protein